MISEIRIRNFKSIENLVLKPGRVTVLIGENGSGKTNVLEAIAFASGAAANKLDNEFLFNRGIRVTDHSWMFSAFPPQKVESESDKGEMRFFFKGGENESSFDCKVISTMRPNRNRFARWLPRAILYQGETEQALQDQDFLKGVQKELEEMQKDIPRSQSDIGAKDVDAALRRAIARNLLRRRKQKKFRALADTLRLTNFIIYSPDSAVLRAPPPEGAIEPVGVKGEGFFKLLFSLSESKNAQHLKELKRRLHLFGWFDDILPPNEAMIAQARIQIRDRFLATKVATFDQRSANEGFLYVLFYFTILLSSLTPRFFALDNVDNALNPKLCTELMKQIVELAKKYDKQLICTTHNPAVLDGLNLNDEEQRLFAVYRDSDGHTCVNRINPPHPQQGELPIKLSEAFLNGLIGGLPELF